MSCLYEAPLLTALINFLQNRRRLSPTRIIINYSFIRNHASTPLAASEACAALLSLKLYSTAQQMVYDHLQHCDSANMFFQEAEGISSTPMLNCTRGQLSNCSRSEVLALVCRAFYVVELARVQKEARVPAFDSCVLLRFFPWIYSR